MSLELYNTRTRSKQHFEPIDAQHVRIYVCGPTVYNRVHIGNARPAVVFDLLYRVLKTQYAQVTYARNITDIDDKIINAAKAAGEPIEVLTARFTQAYFDDMAALHNVEPDLQPRATETIAQMIAMTKNLIASGHAYEAEGHVLFAVQSMPDYGKLSNRSLDDMLAGARVDVAPYKKYAGDFVLWKPSSDDDPGWESPWGRGRPGWHLECSAMIEKHLGECIDIHGGGRDLIFPHHENELAQSQCAHDGKSFVNFWVHNGYINIDGEKMSKSLDNFRLVHDLLQHYNGETLRFALLSAQYRSELNFSAELLEQAKASLDTLYSALQTLTESTQLQAREQMLQGAELQQQACYRALLDDLNTPIAISELHALAKKITQTEGRGEQALQHARALLGCASLMGLLQATPQQWFQGGAGGDQLDEALIASLIAEREQAKLDKNYARADEIRQQLLEQGVTLEDSREGTRWRRS
ncbi:MAG: cysteine--tRNA ligase [Pseudomonadales bacterium]|nr:cysteine--tRNA ligase [Pseudomonadales bacterium]